MGRAEGAAPHGTPRKPSPGNGAANIDAASKGINKKKENLAIFILVPNQMALCLSSTDEYTWFIVFLSASHKEVLN